jgi:hypothetical protein
MRSPTKLQLNYPSILKGKFQGAYPISIQEFFYNENYEVSSVLYGATKGCFI